MGEQWEDVSRRASERLSLLLVFFGFFPFQITLPHVWRQKKSGKSVMRFQGGMQNLTAAVFSWDVEGIVDHVGRYKCVRALPHVCVCLCLPTFQQSILKSCVPVSVELLQSLRWCVMVAAVRRSSACLSCINSREGLRAGGCVCVCEIVWLCVFPHLTQLVAVEGIWDSGTQQQEGRGPTSANTNQAESQKLATEMSQDSHSHLHASTQTHRNAHIHMQFSIKLLGHWCWGTSCMKFIWLFQINVAHLGRSSHSFLHVCFSARQLFLPTHNGLHHFS